ncbi:Mss4-like protein [Aspergillus pseudodeflectus]|uniref:Mss4-like protein n=1 Tax=Aspergillus pseudodeflectus TaxID=176178 RepID=A0ABR4KAI5_9EURO
MTYKGSCHCGAVKFSFTLATPLEESEVTKCNCSMCSRNGYLLVYPKGSDVALDHAEDAVTEYRFNTKQFPHYFCSTCGSSVYAKGPEAANIVAVNVRVVEGVDIENLKLKPMNGKDY